MINSTDLKKEDYPLIIDVMSEEFNAAGDGITNDRAAIQKAIDTVFLHGGGTVILSSGRRFLSGNLLMRSNVELHFGAGSVLSESPSEDDYVEVVEENNLFKPWKPYTDGMELPEDDTIWKGVKYWRNAVYYNYPLIYAGKGTKNIKITGNGTIETSKHPIHHYCKGFIHLHLLGFYGVKGVTVSGITLNYEGAMGADFIMCDNGLIENVTMNSIRYFVGEDNDPCGVADGLSLDRCQNFIVRGSIFRSGDDALKIANKYGDPRKITWGVTDYDMRPTKNIEVVDCDFPSWFGGLVFFTTGAICPVLDQAEISDIYVHNCHIGGKLGLKAWTSYNFWESSPMLYTKKDLPMKNIRFENNIIDQIDDSWLKIPVSHEVNLKNTDKEGNLLTSLHSMTELRNGNFEECGLGYWITSKKNNAVIEIRLEKGNHYIYLDKKENGDISLFQGIFLTDGKYVLKARIKTGEDAVAKLFLASEEDIIISSKEFIGCFGWTDVFLNFDLSSTDFSGRNYKIGLKNAGINGWIAADDFRLIKE